jgi:hypothetical protein
MSAQHLSTKMQIHWQNTRRPVLKETVRLLEIKKHDQHDAYVSAAWLRQVDADGSLERFLNPPLPPRELQVARIEGWILGVQ